jgi:hypothetical protein
MMHKLDKMFFSILDFGFNEKFYTKKMIESFRWNTTYKFQNYIEKVDWRHYAKENYSKVDYCKHAFTTIKCIGVIH